MCNSKVGQLEKPIHAFLYLKVDLTLLDRDLVLFATSTPSLTPALLLLRNCIPVELSRCNIIVVILTLASVFTREARTYPDPLPARKLKRRCLLELFFQLLHGWRAILSLFVLKLQICLLVTHI